MDLCVGQDDVVDLKLIFGSDMKFLFGLFYLTKVKIYK